MGISVKLIIVIVAVLIVAGFLSGPVYRLVSERRYNMRSQAINKKIIALESRNPKNISEKMWSECVAWASIAHVNICFSERHTSYQAMCDFENRLDEKLKTEVDLSTIEWIGKRLAETGPHGQRYMTVTVKWWKQWEGILEEIGQEHEP